MVHKLFAIQDLKAESFSSPISFGTTGAAQRFFEDLVNDKTTNIGKHPGDYRLCLVGHFDIGSGIVEGLRTPEGCGLGSDFVVREG